MSDKYTVKRGDTLWDLSRRLGTTVDELMRLNPQIQNRDRIYAGAKMTLPPPAQPAKQTGVEGASPRRETVSGSSSTSPLKEMGISATGTLPLERELRPMQFPGATMAAPALSGPQQDAVMASQGMESTPELAALQLAGAGAMIPGMMRGIPALARMAPTTAPVGMLGN
jgi:LysM repeat protein